MGDSTLAGESARRRVWALRSDLERIVARDPDREISGAALAALRATLSACQEALGERDPMVSVLADLLPTQSPTDALRAADALLVVHQVAIVLGPPPRRGALFG